jgi:hypothetical protein
MSCFWVFFWGGDNGRSRKGGWKFWEVFGRGEEKAGQGWKERRMCVRVPGGEHRGEGRLGTPSSCAAGSVVLYACRLHARLEEVRCTPFSLGLPEPSIREWRPCSGEREAMWGETTDGACHVRVDVQRWTNPGWTRWARARATDWINRVYCTRGRVAASQWKASGHERVTSKVVEKDGDVRTGQAQWSESTVRN